MTVYLSALTRGYVNYYAGLSRIAWQAIILTFIESLLIGEYWFLPLYFFNELNIDVTRIGMLLSCYGGGALLGGLLDNYLAKRISPSLISTGRLFFQAFALLAMLKITFMHFLILDMLLMGIASYSFLTVNYNWVLEQCRCEDERLKALNLLNIATNLGLGVAALTIGTYATNGFRDIIFYSSVLLLVVAMYCYSLSTTEFKLLPGVFPLMDALPDENRQAVTKGSKLVVRLSLFCLFWVTFIVYQSSSAYTPYIQEKFPDYGIKGATFLYALNYFLGVIIQAPIMQFCKNYNKVLIMGCGAFLLGFSMFMLSFSYFFSMVVLADVIYTVGESLFYSYSQLLCYEYTTSACKYQGLGMYRMMFSISRVIAPVMGGYIYQQFGANVLWGSCGLIGLCCLLYCIYNEKRFTSVAHCKAAHSSVTA